MGQASSQALQVLGGRATIFVYEGASREKIRRIARVGGEIVTIETEWGSVFDPAQIADVRIATRVNGETRQSGSTADLVFGVGELVSFVSSIMTLLPGDIVLTGTSTAAAPMSDFIKQADEVGLQSLIVADGLG